jgi:hypothetical protein
MLVCVFEQFLDSKSHKHKQTTSLLGVPLSSLSFQKQEKNGGPLARRNLLLVAFAGLVYQFPHILSCNYLQMSLFKRIDPTFLPPDAAHAL